MEPGPLEAVMKVRGVWSHKGSGLSSADTLRQLRWEPAPHHGELSLASTPAPPLELLCTNPALTRGGGVGSGWGVAGNTRARQGGGPRRQILTAVSLTTWHFPEEDSWRAGVGLSGKAVFSPLSNYFTLILCRLQIMQETFSWAARKLSDFFLESYQ